MLAVIVSVCLISDPQVCKDEHIPLSVAMSPGSCMMSASPHLAQWSEEHPGWRIVKWRCRPAHEVDL